MSALYNENDPFAAQWLRNLIAKGLIEEGAVDDRSIEQVEAADVDGFARCHWFAGIAGWDIALRLAGWPTDRPVWTASCPCQPLSSAGKRRGADDARHLWPELARLIRECRPDAIIGEQTSSRDGLDWLDGVSLDLEEIGYRVGAVVLPAACVGAPHQRHRIWFVADVGGERIQQRSEPGHRTPDGVERETRERERGGYDAEFGGEAGNMANTQRQGRQGDAGAIVRGEKPHERARAADAPAYRSVGDAEGDGRRESDGNEHCATRGRQSPRQLAASIENFWSDFDIVWCDERELGRGWVARRVEPGTFPLAPRIPARVGRLRAYGNAINPHCAAAFIRAYMESERDKAASAAKGIDHA